MRSGSIARRSSITGPTMSDLWVLDLYCCAGGAARGYQRMRHGVYREGPYVAAYGNGGGKATVAEMQHALGIDWTSEREELTEAIPPAYTEHIGRSLMDSLALQGRHESMRE
jgi:hypothetical protein